MERDPLLSRRVAMGLLGGLTSLATESLAEPVSDAGPVIDVCSVYGAKGDGLQDDTEALQNAIKDVSLGRKRGKILLRGGVYRITRTLEFPVGAGGGLVCGSGCYIGDPREERRTGPFTVLVWDGEAGGVMIAAAGNLGWKIANITFVGNAVKGGARRAGVIYHCKSSKNFGSGEGLFEACWFVDAEVGVKMGQERLDDCCADYVFVQCGFIFCGVGLYVSNSQGVNYNFLYLAASWCDSVIVAANGGHFYVQNAQIVGCGNPNKNSWVFDFGNLNDNASIVSINGLRVEQRTRRVMRAAGMGRVVIIGYEEAQANQATEMFEISGVSLSILHSRVVTCSPSSPHMNLLKGPQPSRFVATDVFFDVEAWSLPDWVNWVSNSSATLERCYYSNKGATIPFWTNDPFVGQVVLQGATNGTEEVELTQFGKAGLSTFRVDADRLLSVRLIARSIETGEVAVEDQDYTLIGSAAHKLSSHASWEAKWGALDVRFSDDRASVRFFVRPAAKTKHFWKCLVKMSGV